MLIHLRRFAIFLFSVFIYMKLFISKCLNYIFKIWPLELLSPKLSLTDKNGHANTILYFGLVTRLTFLFN